MTGFEFALGFAAACAIGGFVGGYLVGQRTSIVTAVNAVAADAAAAAATVATAAQDAASAVKK